jgi:NAD(P)H-hydrate epimerase
VTDEAVLTRAQVRAVDAALIGAGVAGVLLMENAGRGALEEVLRVSPAPRRAVVLAGPGNNGGDALVVARHLRLARPDLPMLVVTLQDPSRFQGDAAVMRDALTAVGVHPEPVDALDLDALFVDVDLVVDGLFGTGLTRPLDGAARALVHAANARSIPAVVALDLPSGLDADTGAALGEPDDVLRATLTCTIAALKPGLLTGLGRAVCGDLRVIALGAPVPWARFAVSTWRSAHRAAAPRAGSAHKGDAGHVLVIGGAAGKVGAALLAARGAHRAGAGLVTVASPCAAAVDSRVLESMSAALPLNPDDLEAALRALLPRARAIVLGPGIGLDAWAAEVVRCVFSAARVPCVIDADALSLAAPVLVTPAVAPRVLTPHPLELARMLAVEGPRPAAVINADRFGAARLAASRFDATVLLKGAGTVIATPDGRAWVLPYAEPTLGVAGSGDVLAGAVGARLAEEGDSLRATLQAAHAHGLAGATLRAQRGAVRGALASEIADALSACLDVTHP